MEEERVSRRDQIRMTESEIRQFMTERPTVIVCSNGPGGLPHPMPMWFIVDDEQAIRMTTFAKSQKVLNLRRDPRVSLLFEAGERYEELRGVLGYGQAELTEETEAILPTLMAITIRRQGLDPAAAEGLKEAMRRQAAKRVEIRVKPERIVSWDHRKLGGVY
jgi:nitroimidazol reductase NimA-like FMN-containing flavoprotein (pyridoxamine 5'-phosphate oxidase superfamily)